jgi:5'-nucleotidase / UDP-sugar diphosphatase
MESRRCGRLRRAAGLVLAALSLCLAGTAAADPVHVTFLHFNDATEIDPPAREGGLARAATLFRQERAKQINTIITYGGDLLSPSFMSGLTQGRQMIELMNELKLDYAALGSHEFDFGPEVLRQRMSESKFLWLATGTRDADGTPFGGAAGTALRRFSRVTIGFFAVLTPETAVTSLPGPHVNFLPTVDVAQEAVRALRAAGADVVVALTHESLDDDKALVDQVRGIDLVLGGNERGAVAITEQGVPILKTAPNAENVAVVDMAIDKTKDHLQVTSEYRLVPTDGVKPNAAIAAKIKGYVEVFRKLLAQQVATLASELDSRQDLLRTGESSMGDLIADAMRTAGRADVALVNAGSIRGDKLYPAGSTLTREDIQRELPFNNALVVVKLKGADLLAALENGVSKVADHGGRFLQVSGIAFTFDPGKPVGKRIGEVMIGGSPIDRNRDYKVAVNDFMARGGDGYTMLAQGETLVGSEAGRMLTKLVADYLQAKGTVSLQTGGRIRQSE